MQNEISDCLETIGDSYFLDSESPPKIFYESDFDCVLRKNLDQYRSLRRNDTMVAITLTLSPKEVKACSLKSIPQITYFRNKMIDRKIPGIYITESTKKGVKHLHGIAFVKKDADINNQTLYSIWKSSVNIKRIPNYENYLKWTDYMCKNLTTPDIDRWLGYCIL